jgi:hypothetical protein
MLPVRIAAARWLEPIGIARRASWRRGAPNDEHRWIRRAPRTPVPGPREGLSPLSRAERSIRVPGL